MQYRPRSTYEEKTNLSINVIEQILVGFRVSFFPGFQLPGKEKLSKIFPVMPGYFWDPKNPWNYRNSRNFREIFPKIFPELDYLATRGVTKTFFLNFSISNPILRFF